MDLLSKMQKDRRTALIAAAKEEVTRRAETNRKTAQALSLIHI